MADPATRFQLNTLRSRLQAVQYRFSNEVGLHDLIALVLDGAGFTYEREYRIDAENRADFWIDGVVIEVKVDGALEAAWRQCRRYAKLPRVRGVLLASTCSWARGHAAATEFRDQFALAHLRRSAL